MVTQALTTETEFENHIVSFRHHGGANLLYIFTFWIFVAGYFKYYFKRLGE